MDDSIRQSVCEFLGTCKIKHSDAWTDEMVKNVKESGARIPRIYDKMLTDLGEDGEKHVKYKFPSLDEDTIKDFLQSVYEDLLNGKFHPGEQQYEEWGWFKYWIVYKCLDHYKKHVIGKDIEIDEYAGEVIIDKKTNQPKVKKIYAKIESIDDDDDASPIKLEQNENENLINSKNDVNYGKEAKNIADDNSEDTEDKEYSYRDNIILSAENYYDDNVAEFVHRYYLLKDVVTYAGIQMPRYGSILHPGVTKVIEKKTQNSFKSDYGQDSDFFLKRHRLLKTFPDRFYMELCINLMKKGKQKFEEEISLGYFKKEDKSTIPILSAVAVDANGKIIDSCFKGQVESKSPQGKRRTFEKHCEYTLFEEVITLSNDKVRLNGGTLYITLEPCNKRKFFCKNPDCNDDCAHGEKEPKIPCAVRCLESGIAKLYIGMYDTNKNIYFQGYSILKNGEYAIMLKDDGSIDSTEKDKQNARKEIESQHLMESYLKDKGYCCKTISNEKSKQRVYKISNGINVKFFDEDLLREICELNKDFLMAQNYKIFY